MGACDCAVPGDIANGDLWFMLNFSRTSCYQDALKNQEADYQWNTKLLKKHYNTIPPDCSHATKGSLVTVTWLDVNVI